jgi:hypothetical protein
MWDKWEELDEKFYSQLKKIEYSIQEKKEEDTINYFLLTCIIAKGRAERHHTLKLKNWEEAIKQINIPSFLSFMETWKEDFQHDSNYEELIDRENIHYVFQFLSEFNLNLDKIKGILARYDEKIKKFQYTEDEKKHILNYIQIQKIEKAEMPFYNI